MITKETTMCSCNGTTRERATYYGKNTDVKQNANGSYTVIGVAGNNADVFIGINIDLLLTCDGETGEWWPA